jgi:adenylylsulfate kinase
MRVLIMGLPGSGKTTLAARLVSMLSPDCCWLNADEVRKQYEDWDFSLEGRVRQSRRMSLLADMCFKSTVIADFVCPTEQMRMIYSPDLTIWMDTIDKSIYEDTNYLFENPQKVDFHVKQKSVDQLSETIYNYILGVKK